MHVNAAATSIGVGPATQVAELKADFDAKCSERNGIFTQLVAKRAALESKRRLPCIVPEVPNCRT